MLADEVRKLIAELILKEGCPIGKFFNEKLMHRKVIPLYRTTVKDSLESERKQFNEELLNAQNINPLAQEPEGAVTTDVGVEGQSDAPVPVRVRRQKRTRRTRKGNTRKAGSNGRSGSKRRSGEGGEGLGATNQNSGSESRSTETDESKSAG